MIDNRLIQQLPLSLPVLWQRTTVSPSGCVVGILLHLLTIVQRLEAVSTICFRDSNNSLRVCSNFESVCEHPPRTGTWFILVRKVYGLPTGRLKPQLSPNTCNILNVQQCFPHICFLWPAKVYFTSHLSVLYILLFFYPSASIY